MSGIIAILFGISMFTAGTTFAVLASFSDYSIWAVLLYCVLAIGMISTVTGLSQAYTAWKSKKDATNKPDDSNRKDKDEG